MKITNYNNMVYFRNCGDKVEKYKVTIDEKKIAELKRIVITELGSFEHKEYKGTSGPKEETDYIRNLKVQYVGEKYFEETPEDVYKFEYDEYTGPEYVYIIESLLDHDSTCLTDVIEYDVSSKELIEALNSQIISTVLELGDCDEYRKKVLRKRVEDFKQMLQQEEEKAKLAPYKEKLLGLINFELDKTLSWEDIHKVENFFEFQLTYDEVDVEEIPNIEIQKVLK